MASGAGVTLILHDDERHLVHRAMRRFAYRPRGGSEHRCVCQQPQRRGPCAGKDRFDLRTAEIDESGGQVLAVKWGDSTAWEAPKTGIVGDVTQAGSGAVVPFAVVSLVGTHDTVTADARGAFTLTPLIPGRYTLSARDTALAMHIAPRVSKPQMLDVPRNQVTTRHLQVTAMETVLRELCSGQRQPKNATALVGRINTLPNGERTRNA